MRRASFFCVLPLALAVAGCGQQAADPAPPTGAATAPLDAGPPPPPAPRAPVVFSPEGVLGFSAQTPFSAEGIAAAAPGWSVVARGGEAFEVRDGETVLLAVERASWGPAVDRVWSESPAVTGPGGVRIGAAFGSVPAPHASHCTRTMETEWECSDSASGEVRLTFAGAAAEPDLTRPGDAVYPAASALLVRMTFVTAEPEGSGVEP